MTSCFLIKQYKFAKLLFVVLIDYNGAQIGLAHYDARQNFFKSFYFVGVIFVLKHKNKKTIIFLLFLYNLSCWRL